jgi:hypothetical protein
MSEKSLAEKTPGQIAWESHEYESMGKLILWEEIPGLHAEYERSAQAVLSHASPWLDRPTEDGDCFYWFAPVGHERSIPVQAFFTNGVLESVDYIGTENCWHRKHDEPLIGKWHKMIRPLAPEAIKQLLQGES